MTNKELKEKHEKAIDNYMNNKTWANMKKVLYFYNQLLKRAEKINFKNPSINSL